MKLFRICLYTFLVLMLAACSGEEAIDTIEEQGEENPTEQTNEDSKEATDMNEEATNTDQSIDAIIASAKELAGRTTAFEGKMHVFERVEEGESVILEQDINSTYQQNESTGGEGEGYQLRYSKTTTDNLKSTTVETQFYRQPEMASYDYYGPENYWHATDYSQVDESYDQRLDYMSPYDALTLYDQYKDSAEIHEFDDGSFTVSFSVDLEQVAEQSIEFQFLEPESYYYTSDYMFSLEQVDVLLGFDKANEMLTVVNIDGVYRDKNNEWIVLRIQGHQTFDSYMLTGEIRPPAEAFTSSDLDKWDY